MLTDRRGEPTHQHFWIGGSPCAGKSTVAAAVATVSGFSSYSCDDAWDRHATQATEDQPTLRELATVSLETRLHRPVPEQVADVVTAYAEQFSSILTDLRDAPSSVVEGAALMPDLLATLDVPARRSVWMVPTEAFQRAYYAQRAWAADLLAGTPDADLLFDAWMQRDAAFASIVVDQAVSHDFGLVVVDGTMTMAETTARVLRHLGLTH